MNRNVTLTRIIPPTIFGARYKAFVTGKGSGIAPFELLVYGPDRHKPGSHNPELLDPDSRWMVETDTERFFPTLAKAREYINRFFEPAKAS